jgi:hypothetical protein
MPPLDEYVLPGITRRVLHDVCDQNGIEVQVRTFTVDEIMHALLDVGYKGYFTFEAGHEFYNYPGFPNRRHTFKRDTRALNPSLAIHRKKVETAYVIGEYILSQYDCFEA